MAGLLPSTVMMQPSLINMGSQSLSTPFGDLRGHIFHYARMKCKVDVVANATRHPQVMSAKPSIAMAR